MLYYSLFIINFISFIVCYNDKKRAIKHQRRVSERTLLGISFMGGAFGFWVAMYLFRHKTKHVKFVILEPLFVIVWVVLLLAERSFSN